MNLLKILCLFCTFLFIAPSPAKEVVKKDSIIRYERCDDLLFYATLADGKKEVKVCLYDQTVTYAIGSVNSLVRDRYISFHMDKAFLNPSTEVNNFAISSGNLVYEFLYYTKDLNPTKGYLTITSYDNPKGKILSAYRLNPSTIYSNINILNHI